MTNKIDKAASTGSSFRRAVDSTLDIGHILGIALSACIIATNAQAAGTSDVRTTRHNFSKNSPLNSDLYKSGEVVQVCVFCHAPHGVTTPAKPLWNRTLSNTGGVPTHYAERYSSGSFNAEGISGAISSEPTGSSKLCLSCHDGVLSIGIVNVLNGATDVSIKAKSGGNTIGQIPTGTGVLTGFTRNLGTDLSNDHPISFVFDDTLSAADGELRRLTSSEPKQRDVMTSGTIIGIRGPGYKPQFPLEPTGAGGAGQIECGTCHDPHKKDNGTAPNKFLRNNRHQTATPTGGIYDPETDQSCLACHDKAAATWAQSAHANPIVADEIYRSAATALRDYRSGSTPPRVWERACLNCHDTHTAQGARRLLREGVGMGEPGGDSGVAGGKYQLGDASKPLDRVSAIENTCYQCHQGSADRVIDPASGTGVVPDIKSEFSRAVRMPIRTTDQGGGDKRERHNISNADFIEPQKLLGKTDVMGDPDANARDYRHAECTDCHNPHRVRRRSTFYGQSSPNGEGAKRTHNPGGTAARLGADGNVASGVLRGIWGVEPAFSAMTDWPQLPVTYTVKKGDPATNSILREEPHLTREYQLCFKCHSNYGNSDQSNEFPALGNTAGGTPSGTNGLTRYTNVAAEFGSVNATDPPTSGTDQGEFGNDPLYTPNGSPPADLPTGQPGGDDSGVQNHRSWHPVMWPTGRTRQERTASTTAGAFTNIRAPFNTDANIGYQTMYCSDCHGSAESWTQTDRGVGGNGPNTNIAQGPHGSGNNFLLKGVWNTSVTPMSASYANASGTICGRCHDPYNTGGGFTLHSTHAGNRCMNCHVALPHGWKNKAFLVNLFCIGSEVNGYPGGCTALTRTPAEGSTNGRETLNAPPYYYNAYLRLRTWKKSTAWVATDCTSGYESWGPWMFSCGGSIITR